MPNSILACYLSISAHLLLKSVISDTIKNELVGPPLYCYLYTPIETKRLINGVKIGLIFLSIKGNVIFKTDEDCQLSFKKMKPRDNMI